MTEQDNKSDIVILLEQLNVLLARAHEGKSHPVELEIHKIRSEIVRLHHDNLRFDRELQARLSTHKIELENHQRLTEWQETQANHRSHNDGILKLTSEAIGFAKIAINTLVIVNAGAVLAILAFLGNIVKQDCKVGDIDFIENFIWATILAILTAAIAYISQICFIELPDKLANTVGSWLRNAGICLAFASLVMFGFGSHSTMKAFKKNAVVVCDSKPEPAASKSRRKM